MKIVFDAVSTVALDKFSLECEIKGLKILHDKESNRPRGILRALIALDDILEGNIYVDGVDLLSFLETESVIKNFGYIFDEGIMLSNLTLLENIMLPISRLEHKIDQDKVREELKMWLQTFELELDMNKRPASYRNSQLKLLGWIRTIMLRPKVLLIENPFYLLNKRERSVIVRVINQIREEFPILIASIDEGFIDNISAEIVTLSQ
ncbi:MAG: hypothetical protein LHW60_02680 [Candidatus Cloacimonetes bacterium]|nr:hypothetical protein [Candidatus Cloacimonadota bacterium]